MKNISAALLLVLSGCATMVSGTSRPIAFESSPPGATVTFQDKQCKTPCEIMASTTASHYRMDMVKIDLDGHESYWAELVQTETRDPATLTAGMIGAILIVPGIVDLTTGAWLDWPKKIVVTLPEKGKGSALAQVIR